MAKRSISKAEKEKRTVRALKIGGIVFAALVVLAIAVGIALSALAPKMLRLQMQLDYMKDPWDGENAFSVFSKDGGVWLSYEALVCIEDDAQASGGEGVVFSRSLGDVLCVDLSNVGDETLRSSVKKMYEDYAARKGMVFKCASMEELKTQGLIDASPEGRSAYTEGCLLQILENEWDPEGRFFTNQLYFYYNSTFGKGATVVVSRPENRQELEKFGESENEKISYDGKWAAVIASSMIT